MLREILPVPEHPANDSEAPRLPRPLSTLFARLDDLGEKMSLQALRTALEDCQVSRDDLCDLLSFADEGYCRNVIRRGENYCALLLCWRSGQASPIHDHRGSCCGFRVIDGVATETTFSLLSDGRVAVEDLRELPCGTVCASNQSDIHSVENNRGADLITLHIYSPELRELREYEEA